MPRFTRPRSSSPVNVARPHIGAAWLRAVLLAAGLRLCGGQAVGATCQLLQAAALPVELHRGLVLTRGELDGHPALISLDTGAEYSILWRPSAGRFGMHLVSGPRMHMYGVGGESRVDSTVIGTLRLDKYEGHNLKVIVAGDFPGNFDFLLGADFLTATSLEFDLKHQVVRMLDIRDCKTEQLPYWSKNYSMAELIASPRAARKYEIMVLLNGHPVRAQLDSGASMSVVSTGAARSAGARRADDTSGQLTGLGEHKVDSWLAVFDTFTIGDETIRNPHIRVAQLGKYATAVPTGSRLAEPAIKTWEMLLGADFLRAHRMLIDNDARKIVFTYEGGPVFATGESASARLPPPSSQPAAPASAPAEPSLSDPAAGLSGSDSQAPHSATEPTPGR
jgi:predicted aspartyl protease